MAKKSGHHHGHGFDKMKTEVIETILKTIAASGDTETISSARLVLANKPQGKPVFVKALLKTVAASGNPETISSVITALKGLEDNKFAAKLADRFKKIVAKDGMEETKPAGESTQPKVDDKDDKKSDDITKFNDTSDQQSTPTSTDAGGNPPLVSPLGVDPLDPNAGHGGE